MTACSPHVHFDYAHLPSGYHWRAIIYGPTNDIVFYGRDPYTNATVYVGPDGRFFIYTHPGPIRPQDMRDHWMPHDAR